MNRYVITAVCTFTKFMIACEALKTKSSAVYSAILHEMFTLFGPPEVLLGDREFDCADIHLLCLKWGITPKFTQAYDKARTGGIERLNLSVRLMIQNHATQEETDVWVEKLPDLQYSYNINFGTNNVQSC